MEGTTRSLYETIVADIAERDGLLGMDYSPDDTKDQLSFDNEAVTSEGVTWAPGAKDGVMLYHSDIARYEATEEECKEIGLAVEALFAGDLALFEKIVSGLDIPVVGIVSEIYSYIDENEGRLDMMTGALYALEVMTTSGNIECIKFAMCVTCCQDLSENENAIRIVRDLSYYEEFTLFCLYCILSWGSVNQEEEILELAKHTNGWGRIHSISALNSLPELTEETREWVFRNGIHNRVMYSYSADHCFIISRVDKRLQGELSQEDYECVVEIMTALFEEPLYGIQNIEHFKSGQEVVGVNTRDLVNRLLALTEEFPKDEDVIDMIGCIRNYYAPSEESAMIVEKCTKLKEEIVKAVKDGTLHGDVKCDEDDEDAEDAEDNKEPEGDETYYGASIYEMILSELEKTEDYIPRGFSVDKYVRRQYYNLPGPWDPGEHDGTSYYHLLPIHPSELTEEADSLMKGAIEAASAGDYTAFTAILAKLLDMNEGVFEDGAPLIAYDIIGNIREFVHNNSDELNHSNLAEVARLTIMNARDVEHIKFALIMTSVFKLPEDEAVVSVIRTISRYDEFTFYGILNMMNWENPREEVFDIAKKTKGWGRVHAIDTLGLYDLTDEMSDWISYNGIYDTVGRGYSARSCYEMGRVPDRIEGTMEKKDVVAISDILMGFFGPVAPPLEDMPWAEDVVLAVLERIEELGLSAFEFPKEEEMDKNNEATMYAVSAVFVMEMQNYYNTPLEEREIAERCDALLAELK